ncbi:hypothetical protein Patl1_34583 [Pistacia atlantica]|uniref:Uncharacterized protein n=1 Tax=Pistacia atlantica TaxID=434234 RepID=A0ACC0ZSS1_9ROSI|nr:hypothetical protein Patl1_34583 [Pistacia atlantica]
MPKSKHDRVTLSRTKKKGREHKELIVNSIREAVENYNSIYVFSLENMRNSSSKSPEISSNLPADSFLAQTKLCKWLWVGPLPMR